MRFFKWVFISALFASGFLPAAEGAVGKMRIVATTSNLADFASNVAGSDAEIHFIALPQRDIHFVTPNPKDIMKTRKADVFIHGGLDLEVWRAPLLEAVGRRDFISGAKSIDVSKGIPLLEIPERLSRLEGDIHAYGNPHYWNDPENVKKIVDNIADGLSALYPDKKEFFYKNAADYKNNLDIKLKEWQSLIAPCRGQFVFVYHNDWPYFMERFGLRTAGFLEPKAGIPPTAKHLESLIEIGKKQKVRVIVKEAFHENRAPKKIAGAIGAEIVTLSQEAGESKDGSYISMMTENINKIKEAFESKHA